jgi:hypothetical protein
MTKTKKSKNRIPPKLLEALLEHSDGQELFGNDGFFHHLKQGLVVMLPKNKGIEK